MKIVVASEIALDSPRAHAINVVKTAGGFARLGHDVTLCVRPPSIAVGEGLRSLGEPGLRVALIEEEGADAFAEQAASLPADVLYARHFQAALAGTSRGMPTILETHAYINDPNPLLQAAIEATHAGLAISTISHRLRDHYIGRGGNASRIAIVPDGVDLAMFERPEHLPASPLPGEGPHAVYAGHLYDAKGVPTMLGAAALLPQVRFTLVGGLAEDIARHAPSAPGNVLLVPRVPLREVPPYLWHASVLLLVPSAKDPSKDWTSPVKLGEYLASGTPLVCSRIPALGDWLDDRHANWCEPDDAASLASAIERSLAAPASVGLEDRLALATRLGYPARAAAMLAMLGVRA